MVGPTKLKPRVFSSLDMATALGEVTGGASASVSRLSTGAPPLMSQSSFEKPGPFSMMSRKACAERTVETTLERLRTMPGSCISASTLSGP